MNGTLPESGPLSSKSCLTVSRDGFRSLIVIELVVRPFGKNQHWQYENIVPSAWHGVIGRWHVLKACGEDLFKKASAGFGQVSLDQHGFSCQIRNLIPCKSLLYGDGRVVRERVLPGSALTCRFRGPGPALRWGRALLTETLRFSLMSASEVQGGVAWLSPTLSLSTLGGADRFLFPALAPGGGGGMG